jgi:hypothetical protein
MEGHRESVLSWCGRKERRREQGYDMVSIHWFSTTTITGLVPVLYCGLYIDMRERERVDAS